MGNLLYTVAGAAAGLVGVGLGVVYSFQEKLLYLPDTAGRTYDEHPQDYLMTYEDVDIPTIDGVRLHSWLIKQPSPSEVPTLLYFHGNAGNIAHRLKDVRGIYSIVRCNIFMVSYRGYGQSGGKPSQKGFIEDASAAMKYLRSRSDIDASQIFAFGRSIGGAVALALAAQAQADATPLRGVIIENSFTSINDMIDVVMPPYLGFLKLFNRNRWESIKLVGSVEAPLMFISGQKDELVPPAHMQSLHKAAVSSKHKVIRLVAQGSHNDTWYVGGNGHYFAIQDFIATVLSKFPM